MYCFLLPPLAMFYRNATYKEAFKLAWILHFISNSISYSKYCNRTHKYLFLMVTMIKYMAINVILSINMHSYK